ncbi:MAG: hypothetical protein ACTSRK_04960 [Promethearchaeota archaeon]
MVGSRGDDLGLDEQFPNAVVFPLGKLLEYPGVLSAHAWDGMELILSNTRLGQLTVSVDYGIVNLRLWLGCTIKPRERERKR